MDDNLDTFWEWIVQRMNELDITSFRELSRRSGVSHGTINAQKNQSKAPSIETGEALRKALRVSWTEFWTRAGYIKDIDKNKLQGLDAEIFELLQGKDDSFKLAVLRTINVWISCREEIKQK